MSREDRAAAFTELLSDKFGVSSPDLSNGGPLVGVEHHFELAKALRDAGYKLYVYVVACHYPADEKAGTEELHEVACALRTVEADSHLAQWRVQVPFGTPVPSLVPLYAGADWQEREQFDLVGVRFENHPDLRRLMLSEDWTGHPLRKDYAIETGHAPWR